MSCDSPFACLKLEPPSAPRSQALAAPRRGLFRAGGSHAGSHSGRLGAEQRLAHRHGDGAAVSFHFPLSSDQALQRDNQRDEHDLFSQDIPDDGDEDDCQLFWKFYWDSIPCTYPDLTGDLRSVTKPSDFYSVRQWHSTSMYSELIRRWGHEHEMLLCLPAGHLRTVRMNFWRGPGPDFAEAGPRAKDIINGQPNRASHHARVTSCDITRCDRTTDPLVCSPVDASIGCQVLAVSMRRNRLRAA
jgi:hypothetical protein